MGWHYSHSPFRCRASWRLVSMSCSVAARLRGRLPVTFWVSRAPWREVEQWDMRLKRTLTKAFVGDFGLSPL